MQFSEAIIRAYANKYNLQQLEAMLADAMKKMATGTVITQASTGAGTGYNRMITMRPEEAVELYQLCIDYKNGQAASAVRTSHFIDPGTVC